MGNTYFFSAFGTFGNPNGFRQSFFLGGNAAVAKSIRTLDLKTDAIQLFPGSRLYGMRKEKIGGSNLISYSVYTFAKEQNSHRAGTFIGSSLMFIDKIASENLTLETLNEFHKYLEKKNVIEDTITINHSDNFSINKPKDFDKISFHLKEIDELSPVQSTSNYLVVYTETDSSKLQPFFKKALDLLNVYEMVYFTQSYDVAEFVKQKGIFKIVDANGFDVEIQKVEEERTRLIKSTIEEFEKEKQSLENERKKIIEDINWQITQNKKRHEENGNKIKESEKNAGIIDEEYKIYSKKMEEFISSLSNGGKLEKIRKSYNENKKSFNSKVNQNRNVDSLSSISTTNVTNNGAPKMVSPYGNGLSGYHKNDIEKERKTDWYKVATFVLVFLIVSSVITYFVFFDKENWIDLSQIKKVY